MLSSFVDKILSLKKSATVVVDGHTFWAGSCELVEKRQDIKTLALRNLTGLVDFITKGTDAPGLKDGYITVTHSVVKLFEVLTDPISGRLYRLLVAQVMCGGAHNNGEKSGFFFDHWYDLESFIIRLQSMTEGTEERNDLLKKLGAMTSGDIKTETDNGASRATKIETGVTFPYDAEISNPVTLAPFRTFAEVVQPASPFILRIRADKVLAQAEVALFEADGGAWEDAAAKNIKSWLGLELGDWPILG